MDARLRGCIQLLERETGIKISEEEARAFDWEYAEIKQKALLDSKSLDTPVEVIDVDINGKKTKRTISYLQNELNERIFNRTRKDLLIEASQESHANVALMEVNKRIKNISVSISKNERYEKPGWIFNRNPEKKKKQLFAKAVMAIIVDTNDTWGVVPLDKLIRTQSTAFFGDFWTRLDVDFGKAFPGLNAESWIKQRKGNNFGKFTDEYSNFEINEGNVTKQVTDSREAFLVARALWEEVTKKAKVAFDKQNRWMPYNRLGVRMRWNRRLAQKYTREEFINDVAPALDDIHGTWNSKIKSAKQLRFVKEKGKTLADLELKNQFEAEDIGRRGELAGQIYDHLVSGNEKRADWRNIGDPDFDVSNKLASMHRGIDVDRMRDDPAFINKMLKFRDGKSFAKITAKYADEATMHQQITAHIMELSRDISVTKFLGAKSHDTGLKNFLKVIDYGEGTNNTLGKDIGSIQTAQLDASIHYLKTLVRPEIMEQSHATTAFNVLRNIQAGAKLGSAVVTAILDIPVFITTGSRIFNLPIFGSNGLLAHVFPGSGLIGGGKKAQLQYARYIVEMTESWQNAAGARFILGDGLNNSTKLTRGASRFAHMVFRGSGLNLWTKTLQSSAAGIYGRHLGDLIQSKTRWRNLATDAENTAKITSQFQKNLLKYGIDETNWNNLITYQNNKHFYPNGILDANGRLDMYKLGDFEIGATLTAGQIKKIKNLDYKLQANRITKEFYDMQMKKLVAKPHMIKPFDTTYGKTFGGDNVRSKFIALIADAVDTMVMKPSQFDRMAGSFFAKDYVGTGAQIARVMTQFKAHPISFVRKTMARNWQHQSTFDLVMSTAMISASLIMTAAITVQLKEFLKGRPTYDASKPDFWRRVIQEAGIFGIVSDLALQFGGDKLMESFGEKDARPMNAIDFWTNMAGPLSADALELMTSSFNVILGAVNKDKEMRAREYSDLVTLGTNLVPLKSMWWSKMLWRKYITEYFSELLDPKGYKRAQKRIKKRTYEQKGTGIFFGRPDIKPDGLLMELLKGQ